MRETQAITDNVGFIKIHRNILNWEWYDDINTKVLFIHCLLKANYKEKKWHGIVIARGSFITSISKLSKQTRLSMQTIRTILRRLKSTQELTIKSTQQFTIITVENYNNYQDINTPINTVANKQLTNDQQTTNKRLTTTKERKERKEKKEGFDFEKLRKENPEYVKFNLTDWEIESEEKQRRGAK